MFSKKMLGSISPAYGIATGEGAIGKAAGKGMLGLAPYIIAKNAKESDEESSRGAVGRAAGKSGKAEPQEGAPATGRPRGRSMMGRIPMSAVNSKSMRGASTQGMKSGGKVKNPKHVDYEKDLHSWMRTGTDKISGRVKKVEDLKKLKHTPEALAKMGVSLVGTPFAAMASGAVNKFTDISENKKEPSIYSSENGAKKFREDQAEIKRESKGMKSGGKVKHYRDGGIYTADMGQPPQDIDGGSAPPKKPAPKKPEAKKPVPKKPVETKKFAKGGSVSSRADGCAVKGKTNCKIY